jgi:hypothetical protein
MPDSRWGRPKQELVRTTLGQVSIGMRGQPARRIIAERNRPAADLPLPQVAQPVILERAIAPRPRARRQTTDAVIREGL